MKISHLFGAIRDANDLGNRYQKSPVRILLDMFLWNTIRGIERKYYRLYRFPELGALQKNLYISRQELLATQKFSSSHSARFELDNKISFHKKCASHGIRSPKIICVFPLEDNLDRHGLMAINSAEDLLRSLENSGTEEFFIKLIDGAFSNGTLYFKIKDGKLQNWKGEPLATDLVLQWIRRDWRNIFGERSAGFLIQPFIIPAPELVTLSGGRGLSTIKILTVRKSNGAVKIVTAHLKIARSCMYSDSFHATGSTIASIDIASGLLIGGMLIDEKSGMLTKTYFAKDTGVPLHKFRIPQWKQVKELAKTAAEKFEDPHLIAWDIGVGENGIYLMEGSWQFNPTVLQAEKNVGFRKKIMDLYKESQKRG